MYLFIMHNKILAVDTFYKKQATLLPIAPSREHVKPECS